MTSHIKATYHVYMDQNLSNEDRELKFYQDRVKETEDLIAKEFKRIFSKRHVGVTQEEKAFLQAREFYLSNADKEEYEKELTEDLTGNTSGNEAPKGLNDMSRKELEQRLQELGIEDTSIKAYPKNADLITEIEQLQG